jgi:hypothetical protein
MNAQEVDFGHEDLLSIDVDVYGDARNEPKQLVLLASSNAEKPVLLVARWCQSPLKELD